MNKKQKKMLIRIVIAAVLVVAFSLIPMKGYVKFVLFMIPYLVIGYDILKKAGKGILNRQMFDENFLMAVATIGAILLGDYKEGVAVMLFYQIGELFQRISARIMQILNRMENWSRWILMKWRSALSSWYSREKKCRLTVSWQKELPH